MNQDRIEFFTVSHRAQSTALVLGEHFAIVKWQWVIILADNAEWDPTHPWANTQVKKKCVCGNLKSARGVVLCQHHPALTRESLLPVHETRVNKKNHSVFQTAHSEEEHHELHHIEFDFASGEYHIQPVASSTL